jgi:hypothetical protein
VLTVPLGDRVRAADVEPVLDMEGEAEDDLAAERLLELTGDLVTLLVAVPHLEVLGLVVPVKVAFEVLEAESLGVEDPLEELVREAETEPLAESLILTWDTDGAADVLTVTSGVPETDGEGELLVLSVARETEGIAEGVLCVVLLTESVVEMVDVRVCVIVRSRERVEVGEAASEELRSGVGLIVTGLLETVWVPPMDREMTGVPVTVFVLKKERVIRGVAVEVVELVWDLLAVWDPLWVPVPVGVFVELADPVKLTVAVELLELDVELVEMGVDDIDLVRLTEAVPEGVRKGSFDRVVDVVAVGGGRFVVEEQDEAVLEREDRAVTVSVADDVAVWEPRCEGVIVVESFTLCVAARHRVGLTEAVEVLEGRPVRVTVTENPRERVLPVEKVPVLEERTLREGVPLAVCVFERIPVTVAVGLEVPVLVGAMLRVDVGVVQ